jgi:hypothetical protein
VTDESNPSQTPDAPRGEQAPPRGDRQFDPQLFQQRNLAGRLFPGPSKAMSKEQAEHIEGLLGSFDDDSIPNAWRERRDRMRAATEQARAAREVGRSGDPQVVALPNPVAVDSPTIATTPTVPTTPAVPITPSIEGSPVHRASGPAVADGIEPAASADEPSLAERIDEQNELLRAILASSVDTQADARSTAQNSRTFAWAGTVIALFTLVATVISIVAVVQGH